MAIGEQVLRIVITATDAASSTFNFFFDKVQSGFSKLYTLVGGNLFEGATKSAASFEEAMDRVQARSGATAEEMQRLRQSAENVIADLGIDASQAAQGLEILTATSLGTEGALAALTPTINVATLEAINLDQAAKAVTDTLTIFGLSAQDIGQATDTLAKASRLENVTITELAEALREGGGAARQAGLDLQQTVAILDIFAASGIRGSEAGTSLKAVLTQLQDPSGQARQALRALGDTSGDLSTALNAINQAGGAGKQAILAFGLEAGPGLAALLRQGGAGLASYTEQVRQNNGELDNAAKIVRDNLNTSWNKFLAVLDQVRRSVVEPILKPLRDELDTVTAKIQEAAQSEAFTQFKATVVAIFTDGAKSVREFISSLDFTQATTILSNFFSEAKSNAASFLTTFGTIADGLRVFVNGLASSFNLAAAAINSLRGNTEAAEQNLRNIAILGEQNSRIFEGMATRLEASATSTENLKTSQDGLAVTLEATNQATARQTQFQEELTIEITGTQARIQALRAEYERLISVGDTQGAGKVLIELNQLLKEVSGQAKQTSADLSGAFQTLHIQTQQQLENLASSARNAFEQIRDSGTAAPEDIRRAFLAYAQAAIAATKDSTAAEQEALNIRLQTEAAVLQVKDAYDKLAGSLALVTQDTQALNQEQQKSIEQTTAQTQANTQLVNSFSSLAQTQTRTVEGYNELNQAGKDWTESLLQQSTATDNARAGTAAYRDITGQTYKEIQNAIEKEKQAAIQVANLQKAFESGAVSVASMQFQIKQLAYQLQDPLTQAGTTANQTIQNLLNQVNQLKGGSQSISGGSSGSVGGNTIHVNVGGLVDLQARTLDELARKLKPYFDNMNRLSS